MSANARPGSDTRLTKELEADCEGAANPIKWLITINATLANQEPVRLLELSTPRAVLPHPTESSERRSRRSTTRSLSRESSSTNWTPKYAIDGSCEPSMRRTSTMPRPLPTLMSTNDPTLIASLVRARIRAPRRERSTIVARSGRRTHFPCARQRSPTVTG